jgi:hypothetical protein
MALHTTIVDQKYPSNELPTVRLEIHHQFPGIGLVSPVYAYDHVTQHSSLSQRIDADSTTQLDFAMDLTQGDPIGILMYELRDTKKVDNYAISSENEARCTRFGIVWMVDNSKNFYVNSFLIEHNKLRLMRLATGNYKPYDIQHIFVEVPYLMCDNTMWMTRTKATRKGESYKLDITISKGSTKYSAWRTHYIDMDR